MTTNILQTLLIAALLCANAAFADSATKASAGFSIGESRCVPVEEVIQCAPIVITAN